jgi:hypothetical protein
MREQITESERKASRAELLLGEAEENDAFHPRQYVIESTIIQLPIYVPFSHDEILANLHANYPLHSLADFTTNLQQILAI